MSNEQEQNIKALLMSKLTHDEVLEVMNYIGSLKRRLFGLEKTIENYKRRDEYRYEHYR